MTGHTSSIHSLSFSAESTVLVSGSSDATVRVWDVLAVPVVETGRKSFEGKLSGPRRVSTAGILDVGEGKKMGAKGVFVEDASERRVAFFLAFAFGVQADLLLLQWGLVGDAGDEENARF